MATSASGPRPSLHPSANMSLWQHVDVIKEHATSPQVQSKFCFHPFAGGATRIRDHLCNKCKCATPAFLALKKKLIEEQQATTAKKVKKKAEAESATGLCTSAS